MLYIILALLVLILTDRAVSYYGATLGLLHYMTKELSADIDAEKVKQLRDDALKRKVGELLGKR